MFAKGISIMTSHSRLGKIQLRLPISGPFSPCHRLIVGGPASDVRLCFLIDVINKVPVELSIRRMTFTFTVEIAVAVV